MYRRLTRHAAAVILLSLSISINTHAAEKTIVAPIAEDYESASFNIIFSTPGEYSVKLYSPDGNEFTGEMINDKKAVINIDSKIITGDWNVVIDNPEVEDIGKVTLEIKANIEEAKDIDSNIKVAKDITGLNMHFTDDHFIVKWSDDSIGNINVSVKNTSTQEIIKEGRTKNDERSFDVIIPENVNKITVSITPSTSLGIDGATKTYTLDVIRSSESKVIFPDTKKVNTDTVSVQTESPNNTYYKVIVNDENIDTSEPMSGSNELSIPLKEGFNNVTIFAVDEKENEFSSTWSVEKDTVAPNLSLKGNYDDIQTYDAKIVIEGNVSDFKEFFVNNKAYVPEKNGNFAIEYALLDGTNNINISAVDDAGNTATYKASVQKIVEKKNNPALLALPGIIAVIIGLIFAFKPKKKIKRTTNKEPVGEDGCIEEKDEQEADNELPEPEKQQEEIKEIKPLKIKLLKIFKKKENKIDDEQKKKDKFDRISFAAFILICYIFFFHIVKMGIVISGSMEPTLPTKCFVVANRMAYNWDKPKRGDIVLVKPIATGINVSTNAVVDAGRVVGKRIIGIPGDKIEFINGYVYVNGEQLKEEYIDPDVETNCDKVFTVPENSYFLLGDNRENSNDSRFWEMPYVKENKIVGKIFFHISI